MDRVGMAYTMQDAPADRLAPRLVLDKATRFGLLVLWFSFVGSTLNFPKWFAGITPADFFLVVSTVTRAAAGFWHTIRLPLPVWIGAWLLFGSGLLAALFVARGAEPILTVLKLIYLLGWSAFAVSVVRRAGAHALATDRYGLVLAVSAVLVLLGTRLATAPVIGAFLPDETYRATGTYSNPNMTASFLVVGLFYLPLGRKPRELVAGLLGRAVILAGLVATGSFAGIAAMAVGGVWMVLGTLLSGEHPLARRAAPLCAFGILAAMIVISLMPAAMLPLAPLANAIYPGRDFASSVDDRVTNTGSTLILWHESPFWGQGAGLLEERQELAGLRGFGGHCEYATTLAERGVIGFAGLLLLLGSAIARGLRGHASEHPIIRRLSVRHVAALLALCAYATSHDFIHHRQLWVVFALLWALPGAGEHPADTVVEEGQTGLDPETGYPRDWLPPPSRVEPQWREGRS